MAKRKVTLEEARKAMFSELGEGTNCPCCGKHNKIHKYKLHKSLAEALVKLVRVHERTGDWVHVNYVDPTHHLAKAIHWGLVEFKVDGGTGRRVSGLWRPTKKGNDFVFKFRKVPSHVFLYNSKVEGFSSQKLDIKKAIGGDYVYRELMASL